MAIFSVCRLRLDTSRYQTLRLAEPEKFYARFARPFSGLSMSIPAELAALPPPLECLINDPEKPAADFSALLPGTFVISERVCESKLFSYAMDFASEISDVSVNGEHRYIVNVVRIYNALDRRRSQLRMADDGHILGVEHYAFHMKRLGEPGVFKLPETATQEILTWETPGQIADGYEWGNFCYGYRKLGFTGLIIETLAEEESPAA